MWSIQELARATGTTSRTLRHYDDLGILRPSSTGPGGMRYYDEAALPRLLRILLMRQLGLGLPVIAEVLADRIEPAAALRAHVADLAEQRSRLTRQIASVRRTIAKLDRSEPLMPEQVFDEFDHTQFREEVEQRWGERAYAESDRWWRGMSQGDRSAFQAEHTAISAAYRKLAEAGLAADSAEAQEVAARHVAWLAKPMRGEVSFEYVTGLGDMYVADPRFAANYPGYAEYVRDAMRVYAEANLR